MAMKKMVKPQQVVVPVTVAELRDWFAVRWAESDRIMVRQRGLMNEIRAMEVAIGSASPTDPDDD